MIRFLQRFELPHVATFKRRWVRRLMIILAFPQEVIRAIYRTYVDASRWWPF